MHFTQPQTHIQSTHTRSSNPRRGEICHIMQKNRNLFWISFLLVLLGDWKVFSITSKTWQISNKHSSNISRLSHSHTHLHSHTRCQSTRSRMLRVTLPQFDGFVIFQSCRCDDVFCWMARTTKYNIWGRDREWEDELDKLKSVIYKGWLKLGVIHTSADAKFGNFLTPSTPCSRSALCCTWGQTPHASADIWMTPYQGE